MLSFFAYIPHYYYGMSSYNLSYFILVLPTIILSLIVSNRVNSYYDRYSRINNMRGFTGAMAAQEVLRYYGITNVRIEHISGRMTDHYDPSSNVIRLSDGVYGGCSIAAIGIACHEAGHAAQHAENYSPIKLRNKVLKPAQIASGSAMPLAFLGYFLGFRPLIIFGIILYTFIMLFQLITLPVEFDASKRALVVIERLGMLDENELKGSKRVLKAAAMTYVASFATVAANLLRLIMLSNDRRR